MIAFKKYNPERGANWNAAQGGRIWIFDGETAIVKCPGCGRAQNLANYTISQSGWVAPEFKCSNDRQPCDFKETIELEEWNVENKI